MTFQVGPHVLFDISSDDQDDAIASSGPPVHDGEVKKGLAVGPNLDELFGPAEPASEARGHDHQ